LLDKIFDALGVDTSHKLVLGESDEQILGFYERAVTLLRAHPASRFIFIVDENLELSDAHGGRTVSGTQVLRQLTEQCTLEQLRAALFCVRSANDSATDCATYLRYAHTVVPKRGFQRQAVLETFSAAWVARFGALDAPVDEAAELNASVALEVRAHVRRVDGAVTDGSKWPLIARALGLLKGDLVSMAAPAGDDDSAVLELVAAIDRLRALDAMPDGFVGTWASLSAAVLLHVDDAAMGGTWGSTRGRR